jgi:hypothetical protein
VVDDVDPVRLGVLLGLGERHLRVDADQVKLRFGSHLVDYLGDGRSVRLEGGELPVAEVDRRQRRREIALRLARRVAGEPEIDNRDLDPGSLSFDRVPGAGVGRTDPFTSDRVHTRREWRS